MSVRGRAKKFMTVFEEFAGKRLVAKNGAVYFVTPAGFRRVDRAAEEKRAARAYGLSARQRKKRTKAQRHATRGIS